MTLRSWIHPAAAIAAILIAAVPALCADKPDPAEREGSLFGVEPSPPFGPTPRLADGHPDFTGYWKGIIEPGKPIGNIGRDLPGFKLPLTPAGAAALQYNLTKTIDPEALCILGGIPRHDGSALPFEILATPKRLAFLYLYTTYRLIPIDGRQHEDDPDPAFFGHPIGSWDGDTLVIDSVGFKDTQTWADENANPHSDALHTVERWSRPDAKHLHLVLLIDDPKFYTRPFTFTRTWVLGKPGDMLAEYACSENNIDREHLGPGPGPILPNGQRDPYVQPLPKDPPPPEFYDKKTPAAPAAG